MELYFSPSIRFMKQNLSSRRDNFSFAFIVVAIGSHVYMANETGRGLDA
jgi:hypothetical protein